MTHAHPHDHSASDDGKIATDPVCGMKVNPLTSPHHTDHGGQDFHFCSAGCRTKFVADPARYLAPRAPEPAAPAGTIYTCPMHPQIRQEGPGSCPICGMALEPETITADSGPNPELADMSRRFWIGLVLAAPVFVLEMGAHLGLDAVVPMGTSNWIQFALSTPVVLWAGAPFFARGWASLLSRNLNMFTLIAMGVGVAWIYSVVADCSGAGICSRRPSGRCRRAPCRSISRRRPSSPCWCCSARSWSFGRASARRGPSRPCWTSRRRPRGGSGQRRRPTRRSTLDA